MIAQYWQNLNERERWLMLMALSALLLYLFYLFVYSPLSNAVQTKTNLLLEKTETLQWMQQVKAQSKNKKTLKIISQNQLLALISNQLSHNALQHFPYQLQQISGGDLQLTFEKLPFNAFLEWFWTLNKSYSITIKQFITERSDTEGLVKLTLVISTQ